MVKHSTGKVYEGRRVALGTKHEKELVMRPPFMFHTGAFLVVPEAMDTDSLGTFTGEIERPGNPLETVRKKAEWAMSLSGLSLGLASEGSFGPHPGIGVLGCGMEWMMFIDAERHIRVAESLLTLKTNFGHLTLSSSDEAVDFLESSGFPSHAVIVRPNEPFRKPEVIFKGIVDAGALGKAIRECASLSADGRCRLETDMRAHFNPTRQACLQALAWRLASRLARACPRCATPGWGVVDVYTGLPCESCGDGTRLPREEKLGCARCDHSELRPVSGETAKAPAENCDSCNP